MNAFDAKINYFVSRIEEVRTLEKEFNAKWIQYNKEFNEWLQSEGLPQQFAPIDLLAHFRKKTPLEIVK